MKVVVTLIFLFFASTFNVSAKDSLSLYIFLLDDCPICIQYTPTLNSLYEEYGKQISFVGYFPNFSSKQEKIELFRSRYAIKFPLFTDYFKTQAKKFNAKVTPEVILFNHTKDKIMYQGRIDNKFYKLGRRRNVVTEHNLKNAIEKSLSELDIILPFVEPIGCFINFSDNFNQKTKDNKF